MPVKTIKVFVDTDVCIDLLSGRQPHNESAEILFSLAERNKIKLYVSSLSFANIDYILNARYATKKPRHLLAQFKTLVSVLSVDSKTIDLAIASDFADFEDAIQYHCALENQIPTLVTRNIKDYKKSTIMVLTPETFIALFV